MWKKWLESKTVSCAVTKVPRQARAWHGFGKTMCQARDSEGCFML
jgi:hypothetical protein